MLTSVGRLLQSWEEKVTHNHARLILGFNFQLLKQNGLPATASHERRRAKASPRMYRGPPKAWHELIDAALDYGTVGEHYEHHIRHEAAVS